MTSPGGVPAARWLPLTIVLILAAYVPFTDGGLLTDDFLHVERVSAVQSVGSLFTAADPFGFFRPVTQLSLWLDNALGGSSPALFRLMNIAFQGLVLLAALLVARLVLPPIGATLATLAFALTPKAHPIAVLWISARAELLMALFCLLATVSWIQWTRQGGRWRLAGALIGYLLGLLSKETAVLLPAAWLFSPASALPAKKRVKAAGAMAMAAAVILMSRALAGAITPASADEHYTLLAPASRWTRNASNYFWRMMPAPLAFLTGVGFPALLSRSVSGVDPSAWRVIAFSAAWSTAFLVPVLPIAARSELYLYLPTFGLCLIAGHISGGAVDRAPVSRAWRIGLLLCIIGLGGYQMSRSELVHQELVFSRQFVAALASSPDLQAAHDSLVIVPADSRTAQLLENAIGGYLNVVLRRARVRFTGPAVVDDGRAASNANSLRLSCAYDGGAVTLRRLASGPSAP